MHSIFQIRISRNTKCADKTGFPRPGHIGVDLTALLKSVDLFS